MNVFARELTDDLASLVKAIDQTVGKNADKKMAGFVVLLTDDPDAAETQVKRFAEEHAIQNVPLTIFDGSAGPPNYKISKEADVTVHLWINQSVEANHSFAKGELNQKATAKVIRDTDKILN